MGRNLANSATATSPQDPSTPVASETVITSVGTADLSALKLVNRTAAQVGDVLTYTIRVINNGLQAATSVNVNDANAASALTAPTYTLSGDASGSGAWTGSINVSPIGGLATGESFDVMISGTIPANRQGTVIENTATVSSPQDPSAPILTDKVDTVVGTAKLDITKSVNRSLAQTGDNLVYTLTIRNIGSASATNVTVNDAAALALTNPTYTLGGDASGSGNWTSALSVSPIGGLAAGESFTVTISGTIPSTLQGQVLTNTANAVSPQDPTGAVTSLPVSTSIGTARLAANKTVNRTAAQAGDVLTYTITVTNTGNNIANNVTVNDANAASALSGATYTLGGDAAGSAPSPPAPAPARVPA